MNDITKYALRDICQDSDTVFVVDAYNQIFKHFFSHKDLSVRLDDGREVLTGHIYGLLNSVLWLKEKFPKCAIIMCIDGEDKSRKELYPEYKAHREHEINPKDDIPVLKRFLSLVDGVYWSYREDCEADDIAASVTRTIKHLCNKFKIQKQIYLLSSDKDWWQLIDDGVDKACKITSVKKWGFGDKYIDEAVIITEEGVAEEFNGVGPSDLLKFRAITGDSSDNIKGYYRFFKKNAAIIAQNFSYNKDTHKLILNDGVEMRSSWHKFLHTITDDMKPFVRNYELMTLKDVDYELEPIFLNLTEDDVHSVVHGLEVLKLYTYMSNVPNYSRYAEMIKKYNKNVEEMNEPPDSDITSVDLNDLLM